MTWREKRKLKDGDERDNSRAEEGVLALRLEIANWQWVTLTANSTRKLGKPRSQADCWGGARRGGSEIRRGRLALGNLDPSSLISCREAEQSRVEPAALAASACWTSLSLQMHPPPFRPDSIQF